MFEVKKKNRGIRTKNKLLSEPKLQAVPIINLIILMLIVTGKNVITFSM